MINGAADVDFHGRFGVDRSAVLAHLGGEVRHCPRRGIAGLETSYQHLEGRIGRLVGIPLVLELLQVIHEPARLRVVSVELEAELARLGEDVAPAGKL